jgi:hypothetical protein
MHRNKYLNFMNRETLRKKFSALLMYNDANNPKECQIPLESDDAFGLSSNDLPQIIKVFQTIPEGIIYFYLEGDCYVEFDDIDIDILEEIYKKLS